MNPSKTQEEQCMRCPPHGRAVARFPILGQRYGLTLEYLMQNIESSRDNRDEKFYE